MIPKYEMFEKVLYGPSEGNPFVDVTLTAEFSQGEKKHLVLGFYDGNGCYKIRFMPTQEGQWRYVTQSNRKELDGITGTFTCGAALPGQHGPVRIREKFHFAYDDGTPYYPFGTTAYNWVNQPQETVEMTIKTLSKTAFNKIRMGTFPKYYAYNTDDPERYPYVGGRREGAPEPPNTYDPFNVDAKSIYTFDFAKFDPEWWAHFEWCVQQMRALNIEVDLIVFHPYDRWGFANMTPDEDLRYIRYLVARMGAYSNIWWSMANEWDVLHGKTIEHWNRCAAEIQRWDAADHLRSIHNCTQMFDQSAEWITHVSWQRIDVYSHVELTAKMREQWNKPVVVDEICYEGNVESAWGNITGEELTRRFWEVVVRGGYCTHGETYLREDNILWWAKGGELTGTSPERIAFCRKIIEDMGAINCEPTHCEWDLTWGHAGVPIPVSMQPPFGTMEVKMASDMICYFGLSRPAKRMFMLPDKVMYYVDIIDTWNMTITTLPECYSGRCEIALPGTTYIAVRFRAVNM